MYEAYESLRLAILRQAATDYSRALRRRKSADCEAMVSWFRSDWGQMLSGDQGELIIAECKRRNKVK